MRRGARVTACDMEASEVPQRPQHHPGDRAPAADTYELLNVFGTPTGTTVDVGEGDPLPRAPRGYTWRRLTADGGQRHLLNPAHCCDRATSAPARRGPARRGPARRGPN